MKRFFVLILVVLAVNMGIQAQGFGVVGGMTFSEMTLRSGDYSYHGLKSKVGFTGGVILDMPISKFASVNTGLLYANRGYSGKNDILGDQIRGTLVTKNLEIPVNMSMKLRTPIIQPFVQAGPYMMIALSGTKKLDGVSHDVDFTGSNREMKRVDFGFNMGAGVEFLSFRFLVNYGLGFINLSEISGIKTRNRALSGTIAWMF